MFEKLTEKLTGVFNKLTGRGTIKDSDIQEALKEVRIALLEADVNYKVTLNFIDSVAQKVKGQALMTSLTPVQHIIKVVNDELTELMGRTFEGLDLAGPPPLIVMLVGLQGSGKTTTAGKLALYLKKMGKKPYLVPADVARPAAITQLTILAQELDVPVYPSEVGQNPVEISSKAIHSANSSNADVILIDTAGRLSIDEALMNELSAIKDTSHAKEILLVADSMTGQDAVKIAQDFDEKLNLTGVILSKMEGDARAGAAMSMRAVIHKPLKFIGTGEKLDALEPFHPDRVASSILGMGDVLTLIEKAQEHADEAAAEALAKKLQKGDFTLSDFRDQMRTLGKMGTMESILGMIPGLGKLKKIKEATPDSREMIKIAAIIDSMTVEEREQHSIIDSSRKRRIAMGSGTDVKDVTRLLKNFTEVRKMFRAFSKGNFSINDIMRNFS
jgi:signal recognition particle subunit SRP54